MNLSKLLELARPYALKAWNVARDVVGVTLTVIGVVFMWVGVKIAELGDAISVTEDLIEL